MISVKTSIMALDAVMESVENLVKTEDTNKAFMESMLHEYFNMVRTVSMIVEKEAPIDCIKIMAANIAFETDLAASQIATVLADDDSLLDSQHWWED